MKRRSALDLFLGGSLIATIAAFLYPVVRYLLPPKRPDVSASSVVAAKTGELAPNSSKIFRFGRAPAVLVNTPEGKLVSLSAVCTHLTCTVHYEPESGTLFCPCHNGRFDLAGNVLAGPPPRPLETYAVKVSGTDIVVSRRS